MKKLDEQQRRCFHTDGVDVILISVAEVIIVSANSVMTELWFGVGVGEDPTVCRDSSKARLHQTRGLQQSEMHTSI